MNDKENVENVKQLQKLNQKIQRNQSGFGLKTDTFTFRRRIEKDLQEGKNLIQSLDSAFERDRANSTAAGQEIKLLRQYDQEKERFEGLLIEVTNQMRSYEPINDGTSAESLYDNDNNNNNNNNNNENNDPTVIRTQTQSLKALGFQALDSHLNELEDKNEKVEKIAQDVKDINQAYKDLNELVVAQQEDIDTIQVNVEATKENVQAGAVHLEVAEKHQKSYRKKQCYILLCILVAAGIIVLGVCLGGDVC